MQLQEAEPQILDEEVQRGLRLAASREQLAACLSDPTMSTEGYESHMCTYLNALSDFHFASGRPNRFSSYQDVARQLTNESFLITGKSGCTFDVAERIKDYCSDERAVWLSEQKLNVISRAMILTAIDLIDDGRPLVVSRKKRKKG